MAASGTASYADETLESMPKGKHKRGANSSTGSGNDPSTSNSKDVGDADVLFYLRTKYSLLGKSEWWWLMDESLAEIHRRLETENFVVVDGFIPRDATRELRDEIRGAHDAGHLNPGVLAGGKAGDATQYTMRNVRGDHVGWFDGSETASGDSGVPLWHRLPDAMKRADTLVNEIGRLGGEARNVASRSKAMCTVYPGAGARYIRHVDNPDANGRLLTALLYLNPEWEEGDGGELRVFRCLRSAAADVSGFSDCDGRSLAVADEFSTARRGDVEQEKGIVLEGPSDVAEGVRDVVTLRGREDEDEDANSTKKKPVRLTDVAPLGGRLVLFKSDARVPHEVLAASKPRYAMTLWYFHGEEVAAARGGTSITAADREAHETKIRNEIEALTIKYGGGVESAAEVRSRASHESAWQPVTKPSHIATPPLPVVSPPCEVSWETEERNDGWTRTLVVRAPLPPETLASACSAEVELVEDQSARLILQAPGLPKATRVDLPSSADTDAVSVRLVKKPSRALVVRVSCPPAGEPASIPRAQPEPRENASEVSDDGARRDEASGTLNDVPPSSSSPSKPPDVGVDDDLSNNPATPEVDAESKECVGVGGMLSWSETTAFTALPAAPPRAPGSIPRGVDLRGAVDWDDFTSTRWFLAGRPDGERPTLTPHALDGLSFPITLSWATQQPRVAEAIRDARRGASPLDARAAARAAGVDENSCLGDEDPNAPPLTVIIAGASARTEQFLLERTEYWSETTTAAPSSRGGVHLAFVGPDVEDARTRSKNIRRLTSTLTASLHRTTAGAYLRRLTPSAPCLVMGFNTGLGGGGGALARAWAPDLVAMLKRPRTPLAFTCANAFADLKGELGVFKALGARFIVDPVSNPFRAYTRAVGEAAGEGFDDRNTLASCANAYTYAVFGFQERKGPGIGVRDDQLCAIAVAAAERSAGKAWDALGMRR